MSLILLLTSATEVTPTADANSFYSNKGIIRDNFSGVTVDTKLSTKSTRKADLRDTFSGTLNQTISVVGSERGYATRKNL